MLATSIPDLPQEAGRRDQYVGILMAYVEAINPSDAERIEMGLVTQQQLESGDRKPAAYQEDDGRYRLDVWLKGKDESGREVRVRHSIFLQNEESRPSASGNVQVINHQGKTAYIPQASADAGTSPYDWFAAPFQRTRVGESDLVQFINSWTNKKADEKAPVLDFAAICKGNLKPLHQIMQSGKATYVKVMVGVRVADDGRRYQTVFPRVILPAWTVNYERLHKELTNYLSNAQSRYEYGITPGTPYDRNLYRLRIHEEGGSAEAQPSDNGTGGNYASSPNPPVNPLPAAFESNVSSVHDDDLPF